MIFVFGLFITALLFIAAAVAAWAIKDNTAQRDFAMGSLIIAGIVVLIYGLASWSAYDDVRFDRNQYEQELRPNPRKCFYIQDSKTRLCEIPDAAAN